MWLTWIKNWKENQKHFNNKQTYKIQEWRSSSYLPKLPETTQQNRMKIVYTSNCYHKGNYSQQLDSLHHFFTESQYSKEKAIFKDNKS